MAIKLSNLEKISEQIKIQQYLFSDLHLDITTSDVYSPSTKSFSSGNDIAIDYDINAIVNSLRNLFNTKPGQRFLFPAYGLDLEYFLFEPVTDINAESISAKIINVIETYEPRVAINQVFVEPDVDNMSYSITISVNIPLFNTQVSLDLQLDTKVQSLIFINTNRT